MQTNEFPRKVLVLDRGDANSITATGQNGYGSVITAATTAGHRVLGFFDFDSMVSFDDTTVPSNLNKMSVAMAYKKSGSTAYNAIKTQPSNWIYPEDITSITRVDYSAGQNQISDVTWNADYLHCSEDFGIRVRFHNDHIDSIFPFGLIRSYVTKPVCNDADCNCPEVRCVESVFNLAGVINADVDALVTAEVGYYTTAGDPTTFTVVSDASAWDTNTMGECPVMRLTFNQLVIQGTYCNPTINAGVSDVVMSDVFAIIDLQSDSITITSVQDATKEINSTRLIQSLEYGEHSNMWYGHRNSPYYNIPQSLVDADAYYTLFAIAYDNKQYSKSHSTMRHNGILYIAVPGTYDSNNNTFTPGAVVTNIGNVLSAIADEYNISTNL